jgi:uncharacterized protein (TIGR03435 family)
VLKTFLTTGIAGLALATVAVAGQTPPSGPTFEVAVIKPSVPLTDLRSAEAKIRSGQLRIGLTVVGARVEIGFMSLAELIRTAYDVKPYQISGPDWMTSERFDVTAKLPDGATKDQVNVMLQALLAERFKLTLHREKKDRPVYALVVGKGGSKLKESAPDADAVKSDAAKGDAPAAIVVNGQSVVASRDGRGAVMTGGPTGPVRISIGPAGEHIEALKITMPAFATVLTGMVDRPVLDMTGLTGTYQLALDIPMADLQAMAMKAAAAAGIQLPVPLNDRAGGDGRGFAPVASDPGGSSIFQAVQELGLKLEPRQAPVDVIVIDHVEKTPTEN